MKRRAFEGYGPDIDLKYQRSANWLLATIFQNQMARNWCKANEVAITRANGEGIGSAGGYLVPAELSKAILDIRDSYGAFRRTARVVPMASDSATVARRPGGMGAFFTAENAAGTETQGTVGAINLTAKKIGSLVRMSTEVEEDSDEAIVDFVANEIGFAFAALEDDCAFNGDGTSTYGKMYGISNIVLDGNHSKAKVIAASGHATFLTLDSTDLSNLMAGVQASAIPNACWFVSQTGFAQTFCRLVGAGGGYMDNRPFNGVLTPYYLGFPVILTQKLPLISTTLTGKVMMAFGDMYRGAVLGQRRAITLARSPERYLDQDQIAILGTERFHTVIHHIGDNTYSGALAALVAP